MYLKSRTIRVGVSTSIEVLEELLKLLYSVLDFDDSYELQLSWASYGRLMAEGVNMRVVKRRPRRSSDIEAVGEFNLREL